MIPLSTPEALVWKKGLGISGKGQGQTGKQGQITQGFRALSELAGLSPEGTGNSWSSLGKHDDSGEGEADRVVPRRLLHFQAESRLRTSIELMCSITLPAGQLPVPNDRLQSSPKLSPSLPFQTNQERDMNMAIDWQETQGKEQDRNFQLAFSDFCCCCLI